MTHQTDSEEDRLRRALHMIGEEVGRDDTAQTQVARTAWWRRKATVAAGALATAAVCAGLVAVGLMAQAPDETPSASDASDSQSGDRGLSWTEGIACSRIIIVGDVVAVRDAKEPGRIVATMAVDEWMKPSEGPEQVELNLARPIDGGGHELRESQRNVLVMVSVLRQLPAETFHGERWDWYRTRIEDEMPKAAHTRCPAWWREAHS